MSVLVLNASFEPLAVVSVRRALLMLWTGRAEAVAVDPSGVVLTSASGAVFEVPAVVALTRYVRVPYRQVPLTRRSLAARDRGVCQVVGCDRSGSTTDHVVPRSRGGRHVWSNVALMCPRHNNAKSDRLISELGWRLKTVPFAPQIALLLAAHPAAGPAWFDWLDISPGFEVPDGRRPAAS